MLKTLKIFSLLITTLFLKYICRIHCEILTTDLSSGFEDEEVRGLVQEFGLICEGLCFVK